MFGAFNTFGKLGSPAGVRSQSTAPAAPALTLEDATSILLLEDGGHLLLEG